MARQPMKMTRCQLDSKGILTSTGNTFEAQINPAELTIKRSIKYQELPARGPVKAAAKFSHFPDDSLNFSLILDGTGAAPGSPGIQGPGGVRRQIDRLTQVVYTSSGSYREPGYVQLNWGTGPFDGRLNAFNIQYTLFTPEGSPLRAKVTLGFTSFIPANEAALEAAANSPDQTQVLVVQDGETLPMLCQRIYGDPDYYAKVAKANGLKDFRDIKPGQTLVFPALL